MGCSSSSAQTVEQEKRPGTKPEESNGDTVAVRNGIIAEDVRTIEDQMQLPVQTASPDDAKAGPEDETEAVLEAVEAQEDLGSGEDLLVVPEPNAADEELAPQPTVEAEVAVKVTEVLSPVEEALPVETVPAEAPSEVKAVEALEETPEAQPVEAVQTEVPVLAKEEVPLLVVEEPAGTAGVVEEGVAEEASKAATENANPVQEEDPPSNTSPETDSETPAAAEASTATTDSVANEDAAPTEPSGPADAVIDTTIAAASIPEMPPVTAAAAAAQAEPHSATDEETEVSTVSSGVTASPEEASGPVGVSVPEPVKGSESPPVMVNPESSTETGVTAEVSEGNPSAMQTQAPPDPEPATEPVPESSPEVSSVNEASKDKEDEIAKKQD
ncbi:fibrous sheath CABYR-binding protein [Poecilia reticulata]|uniref:fibrous sheath CABYR-binding protein n=1 Tax=Poecilia reticulata TaxID=8081 RepID=UPI0004A46606|nr:PREDICTED: fibrous sheath CABYR-binding protein-like [Poecilia reticulata]